MAYRILADAVLVVHLGFILFVVAGGLLVRWRKGVAWVRERRATPGGSSSTISFRWSTPQP
jgi:hypothetical protein